MTISRKKPTAIDPGCFNRKIYIENEIETLDPLGGYSIQYQTVGAAWAHLRPIGANTRSEAGLEFAKITHKIYLRFQHEVRPKTRFVTGSRHFYVETVRDPDETRRYLECCVVERQ